MSYQPASISASGLSILSYQDIKAYLLEQYQAIYGQIAYTGNDTSDYEELAIESLMVADCNSALQLAYNSRSVSTAIGAALDTLVKPLIRLQSTPSQVLLTITGAANTIITNGAARDSNGILWNLPTSVVIPNSSTVIVEAVCAQYGTVQASIGTINQIAFGTTSGWNSVTNLSNAIVGQPVETDAQLRARYAYSVAVSSQTVLAGTIARVNAVSGVTRVNIFENYTGAPDRYGTPAHSITCVIEGGGDTAVATSIYLNRGIGVLTNGNTPSSAGSTSVTVYDQGNGVPFNVGFYRPIYTQIYVALTIHGLNPSFTTAMQNQIVTAITQYLNSLSIGETVTISVLQAVAQTVSPSLINPSYSVISLSVATSPNPTDKSDIPIAFNAVAQSSVSNVAITVQ